MMKCLKVEFLPWNKYDFFINMTTTRKYSEYSECS